MKKKIFGNWGLKLVALFVAFGLWYVWAYSEDPLGESTFTNIQVQFLNEDILQEQNLVSEVLDRTDVVRRVTVKGRRKTLDEMRDLGANVIATADFSKMNEEDHTIPIVFSVPSRFSGPEIEITQTDGSPVVRLLVEELKSENVRVEARTTGTVREGYQIVDASTDENMITISGGTSKVDQVYCAAVLQDVSGANEDIISSGSILLFDRDGNQLNASGLQRSLFTTRITVRINPTKEVPVLYEPYGVPAEGYLTTGEVEGSLQSIRVVGSSTLLNSLDSIVIGGARSPVDITDATESKTANFNITSYLPAGVSLAEGEGDGSASVTVYIEPILERTYRIGTDKIRIENMPEDMPENILLEFQGEDETYELTLRGLKRYLDNVGDEQLNGVIDIAQWMEEAEIEEIVPGTYYCPVSFELPEGVEQVGVLRAAVSFLAEEEKPQ